MKNLIANIVVILIITGLLLASVKTNVEVEHLNQLNIIKPEG